MNNTHLLLKLQFLAFHFSYTSLKSERKIGSIVFQETAYFARRYETFPTKAVFCCQQMNCGPFL